MLILQCTKKLIDELGGIKSTEDRTNIDPLFSWHAHLFLFQRRKCVLVMNNESRYNFVIYGLKKADFKRFSEIVIQAIADNLRADEMNEVAIKKYLNNCNQVQFTTTSDRSIISQVNEMILVTKQDGIEDLYELNRYLNRFVMLRLPEVYSVEAMKNALKYEVD